MNTHQQLRANLWCNIATGIPLAPEVVIQATPTAWADAILKDFDERFPEPQSPVDTDPEIVALRSELETERIRLAAVSVVACADTPDSAVSARQILPEYRSAALDDVERRVDECIALRKERDRLLKWKEEQLEMNRRWGAVDEFVRQHPSVSIGKFVDSEAIRLLRERDLYHSQLRAHGITPARLS